MSVAVFVCTAAAARPEAVAIDHKGVGCIVVGKYPRMDACFTPAASLARSRVYFRPEGDQAWYYVDMKGEGSCYSGTLPRPGKKLLGKTIEYYVDAQNKASEPSRSPSFEPRVVKSAEDCDKDKPVAPFLNSAAVAVFPSLPAAFVGAGLGTGAIIGVAAAGAAVVGTTAAVMTNGGDKSTTAPAVGANTPATLAPATPTTTLPATGNLAPFAVLTTSPDPPTGQGPMTVTFDLCKSTDPNVDKLAYFFDFGDGSKTSGSCIESHTYSSNPLRGAANVRRFDSSFEMQGCAVDPFGLSACRTRSIKLVTPDSPPPTPATPSCPAPTITITSPTSPHDFPIECGFPLSFAAVAAATNTGAVQFCVSGTCPKFLDSASIEAAPTCVAGTASGGNFVATLPLGFIGCRQYVATATSNCGGGMATSLPLIVTATDTGCFRQKTTEDSSAAWSSDLGLDGGRLQVLVNDSAIAYPEKGRSAGTTRLKSGKNRIDATVLNTAGKAGTWTIDLSGSDAIQAGSIHVLSGDVSSLAGSRVTFRLKGTPGERVSFTFLRKD